MSSSPALRVAEVSKSFGSTRALDRVTLSIGRGEIRALLGHNGSGKSTLVKILAGYHRADEGSLEVGGEPLTFPFTRSDLVRCGMSVLHQDVGLVMSLSVLENMCSGGFQTSAMGRIKWGAERRNCAALLQSFGLDVDPMTRTGDLSQAERAIVGIGRAFRQASGGADERREPTLLVLDEPTASLGRSEVEKLFVAVRSAAARNCGVLIVTHSLTDVLALADEVSVLRDGRLIASQPVKGMTEETLSELVVGKRISSYAGPRRGEDQMPAPSVPEPVSDSISESVLRVASLAGGSLEDASLVVRAGEIVALTGLIGAGYEEVPALVFGAQLARAGRVWVDGAAYERRTPARSRRRGLAFVSADRLGAGGVQTASLAENVSLPILRRLTGPGGWIRSHSERTEVERVLSRFQVRASGADVRFGLLSGGNQQKALVGRWIASEPRLLLMCEPTSGVDIGAVEEMSEILREFAEDGGAVLFASAQFEDIVKIAHRALVFASGVVVGELAGATLTSDELLLSSVTRTAVKVAAAAPPPTASPLGGVI